MSETQEQPIATKLALRIADLESELARLREENDKLKNTCGNVYDECKLVCDGAMREFGYDGLRFKDVRHGALPALKELAQFSKSRPVALAAYRASRTTNAATPQKG